MAKLNVILRDSGGNSKAGYRVAVYNGSGESVADTNHGTMIDNDDGSYVSRTNIDPGTYTVKYSTTPSGTLAIVPGYEAFSFGAIHTGTVHIEDGGTGGVTVEEAQRNLELEPGVNVLEYDLRFELMKTSADGLAEDEKVGVCISDYPNGNFAFVDPDLARPFLGLEVGTDVQAWSQALDDFAAIAMPSGITYKFPIASPIEGWFGAVAADTRTLLGLGTVATESTVPVDKGGTGGKTKLEAQQNLDLEPGVDIQGHNAYLDDISLLDPPLNDGVDILVLSDGGVWSVDPGTFIGEDVLNLGKAATKDATTCGEDGKVPVFYNGLHLPVLTVHPLPGSSNFGRIYCFTQGNEGEGSFGLYFIGRKGVEATYQYERITLHERAWINQPD